MKKIIYLILFAQSIAFVNAQNSVPDSLFGTNSILQIPTIGDETGSRFILQPDGKIFYGGYDYNINQNDFHIDMMRFDECGLLDSLFGVNGLARHKFDQRNIGYAYKLQPDGKIVCAGMQAPSNSGSQQISCVSRFNSSGAPDSTFNFTGTHALRYDATSSGEFHSVFVMQDGRILCLGNSTGNINGGVHGVGAMRFLPDGTLDTTFDGDGKARFTSASFPFYGKAIGHLLQNGKTVLTTIANNTGFSERFFAIRFDSTGTFDTTFGIGGIFSDTTIVTSGNNITASELDNNENILIATNHSGGNSIDVIRITNNGVLDTTFGLDGHINHAIIGTTVKGIGILANGNILVRGGYSVGFGIGFGLMLLPNGTPDSTFGSNGFRTFDLINNSGTPALDALLELPNGKWLAASSGFSFNFKKFANQSNVPHISEALGFLSTTGTGTYQWYLNGLLIPSATQNTFAITQNGTYTMMITDIDGCTYLSDPFTVIDVAVTDLSASSIVIYPNPVTNAFQVSGFRFQLGDEIKICDVVGKEMYSEIITHESSNFKLQTLNFSEGVYFMEIKSGDKKGVARFVKVD